MMNGGIIMTKIGYKRLMTMGVITIAAVLTELVLQILCYGFDAFSVRSGLRWWGIVPIALIMLYLLFSLTSMQTPNKKQLVAWGLGVISVGLPFVGLAVESGTPFIILSVLCVLLAIGTVVFSAVTVSQKTNGTFWIIELAVTMIYTGGYVLFGFLWDTPMFGFPLGDIALIPLTIAFIATDLHVCRTKTAVNA